jgi:hypothetical protein
MSSASRPTGSAAPRLVAGVVFSILGGLNCLYWLFVWQLHGLSENRPETGTWQDETDAWQWSAMGWLGIMSLVCCVATAIALGRRWRRASSLLCAVALVTGLAPWLVAATG